MMTNIRIMCHAEQGVWLKFELDPEGHVFASVDPGTPANDDGQPSVSLRREDLIALRKWIDFAIDHAATS